MDRLLGLGPLRGTYTLGKPMRDSRIGAGLGLGRGKGGDAQRPLARAAAARASGEARTRALAMDRLIPAVASLSTSLRPAEPTPR